MKKVLFIGLFVTVALANHGWAQAPDTLALLQPAPPAPARPATAPAAPTPPPGARPAPLAAPTPPVAPATATPAQAPPAPAVPVAMPRTSPNVRFDVTITDLGGPKPVTKTLSLTIWAGNSNGSIRNNAQVPNPAPPPGPPTAYSPTINIPLNVDVRAVTMVESGIRASVAVEYQPYVENAKTQPGMVTTNATTVFVDGRRTTILVTADPISDRKTTIEVTATILK